MSLYLFVTIHFYSLSVSTIISDVNECINSPCQNSGKCVNFNGGYRCDCAQGFTGKHCDQGLLWYHCSDVDRVKNACRRVGENFSLTLTSRTFIYEFLMIDSLDHIQTSIKKSSGCCFQLPFFEYCTPKKLFIWDRKSVV